MISSDAATPHVEHISFHNMAIISMLNVTIVIMVHLFCGCCLLKVFKSVVLTTQSSKENLGQQAKKMKRLPNNAFPQVEQGITD